MNKLLKDAIADAKAVRETALANAKAALEEAFAPKLQSMLSHKIKEEMEGDEEEVEMTPEEPTDEVKKMKKMAGVMSEEDEDMDDMGSEEDYSDEDMGSEEDYSDEDMGSEEDFSDEDVSDEDLEEILRELEGEEMDTDESEDPEMHDIMEMEDEDEDMMEMDSEDEEEVDINEIIKALREEEDGGDEDSSEAEERAEKAEEELEEAYKVVRFLRSKLNEVNLLNAKLLFVNKLFRKGQLSESQKVKIIETFDRAKNVREAKLIYATLSESVSKTASKPTAKKTRMMEGFASAPQKKTQIISESNNVYNRFKTLVDYNK